MKYLITKSMKRVERCNLAVKLFKQIKNNGVLVRNYNPLVTIIQNKKKNRLFGGNKDIIYGLKTFNCSGIEAYIIVNFDGAFDIIFNTSPVDASYVEFVRITPNDIPILYTQHLFDRYNERVHNFKYDNYKDIMKRFFINNVIKAPIIFDEVDMTSIIQKLDEGFVLGSKDNDCLIFKTFYDSEESRDNELKASARWTHTTKANLSPQQINDYELLDHQLSTGKISLEDYNFQIKLKGYIINTNDISH